MPMSTILPTGRALGDGLRLWRKRQRLQLRGRQAITVFHMEDSCVAGAPFAHLAEGAAVALFNGDRRRELVTVRWGGHGAGGVVPPPWSWSSWSSSSRKVEVAGNFNSETFGERAAILSISRSAQKYRGTAPRTVSFRRSAALSRRSPPRHYLPEHSECVTPHLVRNGHCGCWGLPPM